MASNRLRSRRARATLAWGLACFVAAQLAFRHALQVHPELADAEFGRKLASFRRRLDEKPGHPSIVMLGSSRVATGFRPDVLAGLKDPGGKTPVAYNLAQVGSGPEMAHLSLKRLLDAGVRPDWVLVEYWPPFWTTDRTLKEFDEQINLAGLDWSGISLLGRYVSPSRRQYLLRLWLANQFVPLYSNRRRLPGPVGAGLAPPSTNPRLTLRDLDADGWWSPTQSVTPEERRRRVEWNHHHYRPRLARFHTREAPDRALRAILALCRRENLRAVIVVLPEEEDFRRLYPPAALGEVQAYLAGLKSEFPVSVVDARTWVPAEGFSDGHHLLPSGAEVFTRRLGREVLQPVLAGTSDTLRR